MNEPNAGDLVKETAAKSSAHRHWGLFFTCLLIGALIYQFVIYPHWKEREESDRIEAFIRSDDYAKMFSERLREERASLDAAWKQSANLSRDQLAVLKSPQMDTWHIFLPALSPTEALAKRNSALPSVVRGKFGGLARKGNTGFEFGIRDENTILPVRSLDQNGPQLGPLAASPELLFESANDWSRTIEVQGFVDRVPRTGENYLRITDFQFR